eukprot:2738441-Pyramimonas_sp.AAC.3
MVSLRPACDPFARYAASKLSVYSITLRHVAGLSLPCEVLFTLGAHLFLLLRVPFHGTPYPPFQSPVALLRSPEIPDPH